MTFACARGSCASEHAPSLFVLRHEPQNVWMLGMEESVLMRYLDREAMPLIFHLMQPLMRLLFLQISQEKTMGEASSPFLFCPRKPGWTSDDLLQHEHLVTLAAGAGAGLVVAASSCCFLFCFSFDDVVCCFFFAAAAFFLSQEVMRSWSSLSSR